MPDTLLDLALQPDNLRLAWDEIADNAGIPGVDRVSIRRWQRNWEERLVELRRAVRTNTYRPAPLRTRRIPKRDRRSQRLLRIPTVTDRVLQRAVLHVLYPILEPRFLDCSFGYRPGLGLQDAVQRILVLRENGYRWLLDADIDNFFDNLDHNLLRAFLKSDLPDASLLPLIDQWLAIGRSNPPPVPLPAQAPPQTPVGVPMGSPLSPLLANLYLHRLDQALHDAGYPSVRYADDFVVFAISEEQAWCIHRSVAECLEILRLRYEPDKTRIACFEDGFEFIGVRFEGDAYTYTWEDKTIQVTGPHADWLFTEFGPRYE